MSHKNHMPLDLSDNTQRDTGETTRSICDDCPGCIEYCRLMPLPVGEEDIYPLLYLMTKEISLLEEELVRWRRALIEKLPDEKADVLLQNIYGGLSRRFYGESDLYDRFVDDFCSGIDPMASDEHVQLMQRLRMGIDESSIHNL